MHGTSKSEQSPTALKYCNDISALVLLCCVIKMALNETPCTIIIQFQLQSRCFYAWQSSQSLVNVSGKDCPC